MSSDSGPLRRLGPSLIAILALVSTAGVNPAVATFPPVWDLKGAYAHLVDSEIEDGTFVAGLSQSFGLVTVRGAAGGSRGLTTLMQNKGDMRVLLYKRGTAVSDNEEQRLLAEHPTWMLRDAAGLIVRSKGGAGVIDIRQPEVRRWIVDEIAADVPSRGFDGTFLDVLGSYFAPNFYEPSPADLSDSQWRDASVALIKEVKAATGKPVVVNGFGIQSGRDYEEHKGDSDILIAAADGFQIEHFTRVANQPAGNFRGIDAWKADMSLLTNGNRAGKVVLINTRVRPEAEPETIEDAKTFALASLLLASEGSSALHFYPHDWSNQTKATVEALGAREGKSEPARGFLVGVFSGGTVAANNSKDDQTVVIGGVQLTVPPQQALVDTTG